MTGKRCPKCGAQAIHGDAGWHCLGCGTKEYRELPPIYPVEVIEVACRALEALAVAQDKWSANLESHTVAAINSIEDAALRIIRDGLASHEKAIRGES